MQIDALVRTVALEVTLQRSFGQRPIEQAETDNPAYSRPGTPEEVGKSDLVRRKQDKTGAESGQTVVLKIPPGTQPGAGLRVRGHGLPRIDGYGKGNLVVKVQIDVPKSVTAEQREALQQFDAVEEAKSKKSKKKSIFEKVKDIFQ